ncbi:MAG: cytochrome c oxidase assembly protein [Candidatus Tectomicrobia bacterium]|nr:cytochrome c oxidase assembly protein [Candidatus Tectomicrobia bacterium]
MALVVAGLGAVYVAGWWRLRRRKPRAARPWPLVLYLSGLAVVVLALLSPLDTFAAWLFTRISRKKFPPCAPPGNKANHLSVRLNLRKSAASSMRLWDAARQPTISWNGEPSRPCSSLRRSSRALRAFP